MDPESFRVVVIVAIAVCGVPATIFVFGPIGRAIAGRIVGRHLPPGTGEDDEAPAALQARLASTEGQLADVTRQLDDTQQRLMDVEERLDFAERLLAQQAERARLGPGG